MGATQLSREALAVIHRGGTPLEILADAAQLGNKLRRLGDGVVGLGIFFKCLDQFGVVEVDPSVFSEVPFFVGVFLQVVIVVAILIHDFSFWLWLVERTFRL